jgi:cell division transport system permease protein
MSAWVGRHLQALLFAAGRLARTPFGTAFTVLVIAIALTLPAALGLLVSGVRAASGSFASAVDVTVYFKRGTTLDAVKQHATELESQSGIAQVKLITADEGLEQFRQDSGIGEALGALPDNPLPHVLVVQPTPDARGADDITALKTRLSEWQDAEIVQIDTDWILRLNALLDLVRRVLAGAAMLLGAGVIAVISNTVRLEILNQRAEIEITKLVGGSNAFVRRPFLYMGALYGALGAALASLLLLVGCFLLAGPVSTLAQSYGSEFRLATPSLVQLGQLLLAGAGLGWIGAFVSAARHLAQIEPRV